MAANGTKSRSFVRQEKAHEPISSASRKNFQRDFLRIIRMTSNQKSQNYKNHEWKVGSAAPLIRAHSLAKHRVVRSYLERYVEVLTANPRQDTFRLTLVDGFAGGGRYLHEKTKEEHSGSPLIMLEAMDAARNVAQKKRNKPFHLDVDFFFIEKDPNVFEYLNTVLVESNYRALLNDKIHPINGEFVAKVPAIIDHIKSRGRAGRTIFVLDQFGYSDVPFPTIRKILESLGNAEIILTFATDFLIDYLCESEQSQALLSNIGIPLPPATISSAKQRSDWRRVIQLALHNEIQINTGAKFYTPFFIRSTDSHRDFWLIHLSGHHRARDVMVGLHWDESTNFAHYGGSGLRMLGYDPRLDEKLTKQPVFYFDDTALVSSQEELFAQLPERIYDFKDGITFDELFAKTTNESPVTSAIMQNVLSKLAAAGVIEVRDRTGAKKRRPSVSHAHDVIKPSPQLRLSFGE